MDGNGGNMMRKLNGGWIRTGIMIWKSEGGCKRWYYDVQIKRADG